MTPASVSMSPRERAALAALCDALHPSLAPGPADDPDLFRASATELGVPAAAEQAIALLHPAQQRELARLLRLLDTRAFALVLTGAPRSLDATTPAERAVMLSRLATSRVPQLRTGFQALKRLSSFLYYSLPQDGEHPAWRAMGYAPSIADPAEALLRVERVTRDLVVDADACVIGSGAGGGVAAARLAARGLRVVVLEAGPGKQAPEFEQRELSSMQSMFLDNGLTATRDLGVAILAGACLGGGTTVNWQTSLRLPDEVRDEWADRSGCDWLTSETFSRALDAVCDRVAASTTDSTINANNAALQRGCDALSYDWSLVTRNARGCDTSQCGSCEFGCRLNAKQSTSVTFLHDAQRGGDTAIYTSCRATRVLVERGVATGVQAVATTNEGARVDVTVRARTVVVAAGGIRSPALLQASGITNAQLGCNLYLHPTTAVAGFYADRVDVWRGPPQTIMSAHFAELDGTYGFRLETAPAHPGLLGLALPWTSPADHRRRMQRAGHASAIIALTRDATGGRVLVRRDGSAVIRYAPGSAERRLLARGIAAATRVHLAAGADEILTLHTRPITFRRSAAPTAAEIDALCERIMRERVDGNWSMLFSAHQMGTCRMGDDPRAAVCDERGQVYGVRGLYVADASLFPGSSGVNPMITVMALAYCVADSI